jgi:hypothetical protein
LKPSETIKTRNRFKKNYLCIINERSSRELTANILGS